MKMHASSVCLQCVETLQKYFQVTGVTHQWYTMVHTVHTVQFKRSNIKKRKNKYILKFKTNDYLK